MFNSLHAYSVSQLFFYLQPLGAADYLALSEHFDVIILRNIPRMTVFQKTEARRFITLIDNLYDNRVSKVAYIRGKK